MISEKCPSCGHKMLEKKKITHTVTGGNNTALVDIEVDVCEKCGEILFTSRQVQMFEDIKNKLANEDVKGFIPVGKNFRFLL